MLYYCSEKDILNLKDTTIVPIIPVNCKGVMGAGLALQFKNKYPNLYEAYRDGCLSGQMMIGKCALVSDDVTKAIMFPSKDDWSSKSELSYISSALTDLAKCLNKFNTMKVAIPPVGCGLGGLTIQQVLPLIYDKLKECKNEIYLVGF